MKGEKHNGNISKKAIAEGITNEFENAPGNNSPIDKDREESLLALSKSKLVLGQKLEPPAVSLESIIGETGEGRMIGSLGNFTVVAGPAKSRKTFFVSSLVVASISKYTVLGSVRNLLPEGKHNVIYIDTEQSAEDTLIVYDRIARQVDEKHLSNLEVYNLRQYSPGKRVQHIGVLLEESKEVGVVFIDGVRDLVNSINDDKEAMECVSHLMRWTEQLHINIITVLHYNKSDTNLRGHLGTEIMNKAQVVLEVKKEDENSIVNPKESRKLEIDPIAFFVDENNIPQLIDYRDINTNSIVYGGQNINSADELTEVERVTMLEDVFNGVGVSYAAAEKRLIESSKVNASRPLTVQGARDLFRFYRDNELIFQEGKRKPWTLKNT